MKTLSDYKGEDAFELWADLMEPLSEIFADDKVLAAIKTKKNNFEVASVILREHKHNALQIFTRIDSEPVDGSNLIGRLLIMLGEFARDPVVGSFFGLAEQEKTPNESSGSVTENIGDGVK